MPSIPISAISGGMLIISGAVYSGHRREIVRGGVQLRWDWRASGRCFIGFSGNLTTTSGAANDGLFLNPGDPMFVPKLACAANSGHVNIWATAETTTSGHLLYYEVL